MVATKIEEEKNLNQHTLMSVTVSMSIVMLIFFGRSSNCVETVEMPNLSEYLCKQ